MIGANTSHAGPGGLTPASRPTKTPLPELVSRQHALRGRILLDTVEEGEDRGLS
jgi:hypothetical protein